MDLGGPKRFKSGIQPSRIRTLLKCYSSTMFDHSIESFKQQHPISHFRLYHNVPRIRFYPLVHRLGEADQKQSLNRPFCVFFGRGASRREYLAFYPF